LLDGTVLSIRRDGDGYVVPVAFLRVAERVKEIRYDRVILATGFRFDASIFAPECRPRLTINDRFPDQTAAWESVNVPDLFFAGTITQARDFKKSTSGFIHGFRYGVRALHRILEHRYHGVAWPATDLSPTPEAIADAVIARVNRTSALWQLFAFMADAVLAGPDGSLRYAEEVPVAHLHEAVERGDFGDIDSYLTVTLEYGADHDKVNPFDITVGRVSQEDTSGLDGRYLHPVIRHFRGACGAEHQTPRGACGADHQTPRGAYGADHQTPRGARGAEHQTPRGARGADHQTPRGARGADHRAPRAGELVAEHHLTENLENEWDSDEVHRAPLLAFLRTQLAAVGAP
jgi:hypothetical protein